MTSTTETGPAAPEAPRHTRALRGGLLIAALAVALVVAVVVAASLGQVSIPPQEVLGSVMHRLGLDLGPQPTGPQAENALWVVRFPRVALAAVTGASLACAGAVMQGVFGNPLAEPGVIGVSSGAAVGAAAVIVFGLNALGNWTVVLAAFAAGLLTTLLVYAVARSGGRTEVVTLLLTGIAVTAVASALLGLLMFASGNDALRAITSWQLGSLASATWPAVAAVAPCTAAGLAVSCACARRLDVLALGERAARQLGVDVERLRLTGVAVIALTTSAAVAFSGIISFVGLVVPHLVRMAVGPGHRVLIPASALGGAVLVVAADLVARTSIPYQELPLGVLTALVGGPFFFWLLRRTRNRAGGWG
ncbi:iron complex transport system permease protein [Thermomonospora echinospora]|uniref:Iron complex transport system permease protein n=1 Tax=Thermomonospora echinospora TaxID=1992 RepID=A0A1H6CT34_9ACTN|nr:iron ABC transporter permease [Thermomonospora echinospora]SEG76160.1 iron complex transport system permease protein [Thermomonospora echinospora]